ncbi:MAG: DUF3883 domain-containing protein [Clostridia bacterium]|nr:DUF3883 domain-containing protein [Clostridia bacterium]
MKYKIPDDLYFRIHHVRPRFKDDVENVLVYMATEISKMSALDKNKFADELNNAIYRYPGNSIKTRKTINNWRTEISALFGFLEFDGNTTKPGRRAIELANKEDLVEFFKYFLYNFQYPGAHIKTKDILEQIEAGVHFKPAQYILSLLKYAEENTGKRQYITKAEACHCIFNDLRCTRDNETPEKVWKRITDNRDNKVEYDETGDVIRYAGDILDYMEIANLLAVYGGKNYYINTLENEAILKFINSTEWFKQYDGFIQRRTATYEEIKSCYDDWFAYVNRDITETDFETDIFAFIANDPEEYQNLKEQTYAAIEQALEDTDGLKTKEIGDMGESLIHSHECQRVKIGGRADLVHLIKRIPTQFAVGYDIQSVELDERKRYIEVKTTISSKPLHFNKVHLTPNEWNTASTLKDRYYVYRLMISKTEKKLFLIQDPVGLYKKDLIEMIPKDGADITFSTKKAEVGNFEELLTWVD